MDGRGRGRKKNWRAGGAAASVWAQRLNLTKSGWPQGGSNSFRGSTLTGVQAHPDKYEAPYLLWAQRDPFMGFDTHFRIMQIFFPSDKVVATISSSLETIISFFFFFSTLELPRTAVSVSRVPSPTKINQGLRFGSRFKEQKDKVCE